MNSTARQYPGTREFLELSAASGTRLRLEVHSATRCGKFVFLPASSESTVNPWHYYWHSTMNTPPPSLSGLYSFTDAARYTKTKFLINLYLESELRVLFCFIKQKKRCRVPWAMPGY
eukprot:55040-Rhodomonas_salina.1